MEINNLKELTKYGTLEKYDIVIFCFKGKVARYVVEGREGIRIFLNRPDKSNSYIFDILKLDDEKICEEEYGYTLNDGDWPYANPGDFEAVTRVVRRLYKEMGRRIEDEVETDRFSLIDLD